MTKPFVPCLIVSKRWFLIGLLFQLPFFTVPSKPGHGIRLDLTKVDDRGLLAAADSVRRAAGRAASWPARRGHGALRIDDVERRRWHFHCHGNGGRPREPGDEPRRPPHRHAVARAHGPALHGQQWRLIHHRSIPSSAPAR